MSLTYYIIDYSYINCNQWKREIYANLFEKKKYYKFF